MKKILIAAGALLTQQAQADGEMPKASPEHPNIIFILADDMGYGDLACYGNRYIQTPNIDRLARTGTSFTQAYAGSGISSPSRCSLMTGRNSGNTRIRDNQCYAGGLTGLKINPQGDTTIVRRANLLPQDTTIATVVSAGGYRTCLVNKWHLFIHRNKDNAFFLFLGYDAPHEPYNIDDTSWYDEQGDWSANTKRYAALVTHMDYNIGRLLGTLDALGLRENTLVIFASDNGAAVMAPLKELNCGAGLKGRKGQLYEGGIRVPLIVNQPGRVPARQIDNLVYFPDFMPTLAALTRSERGLPQKTDGVDISPLFFGQDIDTDSRPLYWEFPGKQRALRWKGWKAVSVKKDAPLELYRIKDDPYEEHNLADQYPELLQQMEQMMRQLRTPSPNYPIDGE